MSMIYDSDNQQGSIIQKTDMQPMDLKDKKSWWHAFINVLRTTVGMKPLYLVERFYEAKVAKEEIDNQVKLLKARADYEVAMAQVRMLDSKTEERNSQVAIKTDATKRLLELQGMSAVELLDKLEEIMSTIRQHGGSVEIDLGEEEEKRKRIDE